MTEKFRAIIQHQAKLMESFRFIEIGNGFDFPMGPVDINSRQGQHELRRLAWCIQEELCEAAEAGSDPGSENPLIDVQVELMDALHFIAEFMLTLGYWPDDLPPEPVMPRDMVYATPGAQLFATMINLGRVINHLKNKPWKQKLREVQEGSFKQCLALFFRSFIRTCYANGMTDDSIMEAYLGKAEVNQDRIDSGV